MNMLRYAAPLVCMLFGLCCIMWGIVASSYWTSLHVGSAFLDMMILLLAQVYVRVIFPTEREKIAQTDLVSRHSSHCDDPLSVTFRVSPTGCAG